MIIRTEHSQDNPYTMLNKKAIEDPKLSWKAKGLWCYLMSRPDNWKIRVEHLKKIYTGDQKRGNSRDAIEKAINELIQEGYAKRERIRDEKGRISGCDVVVYEERQQKITNGEPQPDKPVTAYPIAANPAPNNKGIILKNEYTSSSRLESKVKEDSSCRNSKSPKTSPKDCDFVALSEASFRRVDLLFSLMKENNPKAKPPNREKWAREVDKLERIDGYSLEEIDDLIRFSQEDEFWKTNILSAAKLRKQAAQLSLKMKKEGSKSKEHEDALEKHEKHKVYARYWVERAERTRRVEPGTIWAMNEKAKINTNGEATYIFYAEESFKEQFDNALRKIGAQ